MGRLVSAGFCVAVRDKVLGRYQHRKNAERRCKAERENGVEASVHEMWFSSAGAWLGNP